MPEAIEPTIDPSHYDDIDGAFISSGADVDVDAAFDDAVTTAWYESGHAGLRPSIADTDASRVEVVSSDPLSLALAIRSARADLVAGMEPGAVRAIAVCADSGFKRRRVTLKLDDTTLELGAEPGMVRDTSSEWAQRLGAELDAAGAGLGAGEQVESVELRTVRARYKPVAVSHKPPSGKEFIVVADGAIVSKGHPTASKARQAAVALAKEGPVQGVELAKLAVFGLAGRADGLPLVEVDRVRVAQKLSLKVTIAGVKDPDRRKVSGWLFYGIVDADGDGDDPVAETAVPVPVTAGVPFDPDADVPGGLAGADDASDGSGPSVE